jgi:hypothetical protein
MLRLDGEGDEDFRPYMWRMAAAWHLAGDPCHRSQARYVDPVGERRLAGAEGLENDSNCVQGRDRLSRYLFEL